jgi:hypothetical protein
MFVCSLCVTIHELNSNNSIPLAIAPSRSKNKNKGKRKPKASIDNFVIEVWTIKKPKQPN